MYNCWHLHRKDITTPGTFPERDSSVLLFHHWVLEMLSCFCFWRYIFAVVQTRHSFRCWSCFLFFCGGCSAVNFLPSAMSLRLWKGWEEGLWDCERPFGSQSVAMKFGSKRRRLKSANVNRRIIFTETDVSVSVNSWSTQRCSVASELASQGFTRIPVGNKANLICDSRFPVWIRMRSVTWTGWALGTRSIALGEGGRRRGGRAGVFESQADNSRLCKIHIYKKCSSGLNQSNVWPWNASNAGKVWEQHVID